MRRLLVFRGGVQRKVVHGRKHDQEQTDKVSCVVVAIDEDRKRYRIKVDASFQKQPSKSQHNEREQHDGVAPHYVPEVCYVPSAKGVRRCENDSDIVDPLIVVCRQEHRHENGRQTCPDASDYSNEDRYRLGSGKNGEDIKRTCRVIRISRIVFLSQTVIPTVEKGISRQKLISESHKERCILMITVHRQHGMRTERIAFGNRKRGKDRQCRKKEREKILRPGIRNCRSFL